MTSCLCSIMALNFCPFCCLCFLPKPVGREEYQVFKEYPLPLVDSWVLLDNLFKALYLLNRRKKKNQKTPNQVILLFSNLNLLGKIRKRGERGNHVTGSAKLQFGNCLPYFSFPSAGLYIHVSAPSCTSVVHSLYDWYSSWPTFWFHPAFPGLSFACLLHGPIVLATLF